MPSVLNLEPASQHGTWIEIRTAAVLNNLENLKNSAGLAHRILAVVKANAYGHGLIGVAKQLADKVDYLGVSSLREALELKNQSAETPVLIFGRLFGEEILAAAGSGVTLSVSSLEEAEEISLASVSLKRETKIHIKIDTGMGRLGIPSRYALSTIKKIRSLQALELEGIYTHFPTAEKDDEFRKNQISVFSEIVRGLFEEGIKFKLRHASNSMGLINAHDPVFNMARPGLALYGIAPHSSIHQKVKLTPILTLRSRIIAVKSLRAGESAGYGRDFVAEESTNIAILPVGYSHGYPFSASNHAKVLYQGRPYDLAGRVSMDYLAINLKDTIARPGDTVTLIGEDQGQKISVEDLAGWAHTIPYEIVTRLLPSLPRFYR